MSTQTLQILDERRQEWVFVEIETDSMVPTSKEVLNGTLISRVYDGTLTATSQPIKYHETRFAAREGHAAPSSNSVYDLSGSLLF